MLRTTGSIGLLMLATLLAGCQSTRLIPTISTGNKPAVCTVWGPITYHVKSDTPDTIGRIKVNNARRDAYCAVK